MGQVTSTAFKAPANADADQLQNFLDGFHHYKRLIPADKKAEMKRTGYSFRDNRWLDAFGYDETTGQLRKCTLDLDKCLRVGWDKKQTWGEPPELEPAPAPESSAGPEYLADWYWPPVSTVCKWSANASLTLTLLPDSVSINGWQHTTIKWRYWMRRELWGDAIYEGNLDMNYYVRRVPTGHIEWIHPPDEDKPPAWLVKFSNVGQAMASAPSGGFGGAVDAAVKAINDTASSSSENSKEAKIEREKKEWMKGTYVDDGMFIRRGTF